MRTRRAQQAPFHATLATFSSEYDNSSAVAMAAVNGRFGNGTAGFNSLPIDIHSAVFLPDAAGFEAEAKPPADTMKTDDKPRSFFCEPPEGKPWFNFEVVAVPITVEDAREWAEKPTLETAGVTLVRYRTAVTNLYDSSTLRNHFYPEVEQLV